MGKCVFILFFFLLILPGYTGAAAAEEPGSRQRLVFLQGTDQEFEVYKIRGREQGPTVMILGGIHGDEPGAFLSADMHTNLAIKRGSLIVAPRVNSRSIIHHQRGYGGDMNRKFNPGQDPDPEYQVIAVLKSLMAESNALITLHDGSGFYNPLWRDNLSNPMRYGQAIIADAATYVFNGKTILLQEYVEKALKRVNLEIGNPRYKFNFFNMRTSEADSPYKEHRESATYYALTRLGIPAFCIEASKQLPSLEMKVYQHNLVIGALLNVLGVEPEARVLDAPKPFFSHLVILVNEKLPLALTPGQTLVIAPGSSLRVIHAAKNFDHGFSVDVEGMGALNDLNRPLVLERDTAIMVRKDHEILGRIQVMTASAPEDAPRVWGEAGIWEQDRPIPSSLELLPGTRRLAALSSLDPAPPAQSGLSAAHSEDPVEELPIRVTGFLVEVDGTPLVIKPGEELVVRPGALLRLVDLQSENPLPQAVAMNLRGYVSPRNTRINTGEDRGSLVRTAVDMLPAFSEHRAGEVYMLNAEWGKRVLASCSLRLTSPRLASVTVRVDGEVKILERGSRTFIAPGASVDFLEVTLQGGSVLKAPRFTLAGHPVSANLPQTLIMRDIAINLAVFDGDLLAGKVTWVPSALASTP